MGTITIRAYAKINLALDVLGKLDNGYHELRMIMQQIDLFDDVKVSVSEEERKEPVTGEDHGASVLGEDHGASVSEKDNGIGTDPANRESRFAINVSMIGSDVPGDKSNLAYRAAEAMIEAFHPSLLLDGGSDCGPDRESDCGSDGGADCRSDRGLDDGSDRGSDDRMQIINIKINKNLPVAAGLAGGSTDAAAVILALAHLWDLDVTLKDLFEVGKKVGSDIPFCIAGNAMGNERLGFSGDPDASFCCEATFDGTELAPVPPFDSWLVLCKPEIGVSTAEVYRGIDESPVLTHPDIDSMKGALQAGNNLKIAILMGNVLENYTLEKYPVVKSIKDEMMEKRTIITALMSGSGPTVFGLCKSRQDAVDAAGEMKKPGREIFPCRTMR